MADAGEKVVRRVRLPADRRTPAAARAVVRSVLDETKLESLADAALLLTTELSTNAVVHAGTDLELEVVADQRGLTVTVIDAARGVAPADETGGSNGFHPAARALADLSDRGRGLLLVDHFAHRWGTTHHDGGKGVWFQLDRDTGPTRPAGSRVGAGLAATGGPPADSPTADAPVLNALLEIAPDPYSEDPVGHFATALLTRLADLVGAGGGLVRYDLGEGDGTTVLARYGRAPRAGASTLRVPLALGRPAGGELVLDAPATGYTRPLAALVAERVTLALENDRLRRADRRRQTWLTFQIGRAHV